MFVPTDPTAIQEYTIESDPANRVFLLGYFDQMIALKIQSLIFNANNSEIHDMTPAIYESIRHGLKGIKDSTEIKLVDTSIPSIGKRKIVPNSYLQTLSWLDAMSLFNELYRMNFPDMIVDKTNEHSKNSSGPLEHS